ncbi:MAG TPA: CHAT domain-containing protein [Candidatus Binataceae bacterium]|nr:CHAT domain-containing protein [Candidatus Binataceae bacterium]
MTNRNPRAFLRHRGRVLLLVLLFLGANLLSIGACASGADSAAGKVSSGPQPAASASADGGRKRQAQALRHQGDTYELHGQHDQAMAALEQSLAIARDIGDSIDEGAALNGIGNVFADQGQSERALEYYDRALAVARDAHLAQAEGAVLDNIGSVFQQDGEYEKALDSFRRALAIMQQTGSRAGEQSTLVELGSVSEALGQYGAAIRYDRQAAELARSLNAPDDEIPALNNLASAYADMGQFEAAIKAYETALELNRKANYPAGEVAILSNLAGVYEAMGRNNQALDTGKQALTIARDTEDPAAESSALNALGNVYSDLHQYADASEAYEQSLVIVTALRNMDLQGVLMTNLMGVARSRGLNDAAIFYGKEAVNLTQRERSAISGLERQYRLSYLRSRAITYRNLADLLLSEGRINEALEVMSLLKDEEYREFTGGEIEPHGSARFAPGAEDSSRKKYAQLAHTVAEIASRRSALTSSNGPAAADKQQIAQLNADFRAASDRLRKFLDNLPVGLSTGKSGVGLKDLEPSHDIAVILKETGPGVVAVYTLVADSRCWVVLVTPESRFAASSPITADRLHDKITLLRRALAYPSPTTRQILSELYQIIVAPLEKHLDRERASTIAWSLDGDLRYVPIAALYDGKHYMAERYATVVLARIDPAQLRERPDITRWRAAGLGTSNEYQPLPDLKLEALTNVPAELCSIIKARSYPKACREPGTGMLPGTIALNQAFNREAIAKDLGGHSPVVHIASHYVFGPDDRRSFLLLGDGSILSLRTLRLSPDLHMSGVQLLTLSACQTASSKESLTGSEVDSLAETVQARGAEAVLASLWPVDDESTRLLMTSFYGGLMAGKGQISKASALRDAQVALIRGGFASKPLPGELSVANPENSASRSRFSNPYYWAPFILIGNWRR